MKILLVGATGAMGKVLREMISEREDMEVVAGISHEEEELPFPLYEDFDAIEEEVEMIIDFSNASVTPPLLDYIQGKKLPAVIATTGLDAEIRNQMERISREVPLFYTQNMSVGINVMSEIVQELAKILKNFDIEIVESHHNQKVDAPSGTAELLFHSVAQSRPHAYEVYDRSAHRQKRDPHEVGMSSLRGGTIVGEHTVYFCGEDEILEVKHSAGSKKIFGEGALRAATFLFLQEPGLYTMKDVLHEDD